MALNPALSGSGSSSRRRFFHLLASLGSGLTGTWAGLKALQSRLARAAPLPPPSSLPRGEELLRMQQDLDQTLASGQTPSWLMVVDTRKCIGCDACTVACRAEIPTGPNGSIRRVIQKEMSLGSRQWAIFKPINCLQCDDPPCAKVVPLGMIRKRPDGIVEFNLDVLKGPYAMAAAAACPVKAIHVDDGRTFTQTTPAQQDYEKRRFLEYGKSYTRDPETTTLKDTARKCTFCAHRLEAGMLPACVATCIGGAMYFGNANNPSSLIHEITQGRRIFSRHQNLGLKPRVIYFEESMPQAVHVDCVGCHS